MVRVCGSFVVKAERIKWARAEIGLSIKVLCDAKTGKARTSTHLRYPVRKGVIN